MSESAQLRRARDPIWDLRRGPLFGTEVGDILNGAAAADRVPGRPGNDTMHGGLGDNTFGFGAGSGRDIITGSR